MGSSRRLVCRALVAVLAFPAVISLGTPSPAAAAAVTAVFGPVADVSVYSDAPGGRFGSEDRLVADGSPSTETFLRFQVDGLASAPAGAKLRLWVTNKSYNGPEVRPVAGVWDEATVTYGTRPPVGSKVADVGSVPANAWLEYDVGVLVVGNGVVEMALIADSGDGTDFASREDADPARRPQLVVVAADGGGGGGGGGEPPPPPPPPPGGSSVFGPVADVSVYSDAPGGRFGSEDRLVADGSPSTETFLRFQVDGLASAPAGAKLRLWVTNKSYNGPEVRPVAGVWDEATVTYGTRPPVGSKVADVGSVPANAWLEYDVGVLVVGNGVVEMALIADSGDGTDFVSREDADPARRPQLVVVAGGGGGGEPPPPPPPPPSGDSFSFGLVGDTGYSSSSVTKFLNVRADMNKAGLTFTGHVGDIKSPNDPCPDSVYTTNRDRFDGFTHPLVYTPGDNEWRDCDQKADRLAYLRKVFFADNRTRGNPSMTVERQSAAHPENALWHKGPITFVTLHTVGSDNNGRGSEFPARNAANIAWMQKAFDVAAARGSTGVVIMSHANPGFPPDKQSRADDVGFEEYMKALRSEVQAWGRPVLYVHGDTHTFRVDKPRILGTSLANFTRVEVYGPSDQHWVRVDYSSANPALFTVTGV